MHESGRAWDGPNSTKTNGVQTWGVGVLWEFVDTGYGVVEIESVTDPQTAIGTVTKRLPSGVVGGFGTASNTWSFPGDGVSQTFPIAGAGFGVFRVTIDGVLVQSNPNYTPRECVSVDALLPGGIRAGDVRVGDTLSLFDPVTWVESWGEVTYSERASATRLADRRPPRACAWTARPRRRSRCRLAATATPAELIGHAVATWHRRPPALGRGGRLARSWARSRSRTSPWATAASGPVSGTAPTCCTTTPSTPAWKGTRNAAGLDHRPAPPTSIAFNEVPANGAAIVVEEVPSADIMATSVWAHGAWSDGNGYPREIEFYSDRLVQASTQAQPQTLWFSKTADYTNYGKSTPVLDSDAITVTINTRQVNAVVDLVDVGDLMVMTTSAEHKLTTGADEVVAPGQGRLQGTELVRVRPGALPGGRVDRGVLPGQRPGGARPVVRVHQGRLHRQRPDRLRLAPGARLLDRRLGVPEGALFLRVDGPLRRRADLADLRPRAGGGRLGPAFDRTAASRACAWCPRATDDAVYVTVRRVIEGVERVFVERLADRDLIDPRDAFFVDSGLTYDGRLTSGTVVLTGGTLWDDTEELTATFSAPQWSGASDVGDQVRLMNAVDVYLDGDRTEVLTTARVEVIEYVSSTVVKVRAIETIPAAMQGVAPARWELLRSNGHRAGSPGGRGGGGAGRWCGRGRRGRPGCHRWRDRAAEPRGRGARRPGLPGAARIAGRQRAGPGDRARPAEAHHQGRPAGAQDPRPAVGHLAGHPRRFQDARIRGLRRNRSACSPGSWTSTRPATWDKNGRFFVLQTLPLPATILSITPDVSVSGVG